MNYWLLKTNPRYNDPFHEWIVSGSSGNWHARRTPKGFAKGDKLVIWQSGTGFRVVALGEVKNPLLRKEDDGQIIFRVSYSTGILVDQPDITMLRELPLFVDAGFLKSGPAETIFRLSEQQGVFLYRAAGARISMQKKVHSASALDDLEPAPLGSTKPDRAAAVVSRFERDMRVRNFVLRRAAGRCEYCGSESFVMPGGRHYLEAHHVIGLSRNGRDTVENVIALCAGHHREAHFGIRAEVIEKEMVRILLKLNRPKIQRVR